MERIRKDFNTRTLVMIPVAIALNVAIGTFVYNLKLPIYLDSIGTILVGVLAGPWAGALTGLLANIIGGAIANYPQLTAYAGVAAAIGLMSGLLSESGWLRKWWKIVVVGLIVGALSALLSAPVTAYLFGGVLGNASTDAIIAFFSAMGWDVFWASLGQGLVVDPLDKAITFLLVCTVLMRLPRRFIAGFPRAENLIGEQAVALMPAERGAASAASMPPVQSAGATKSASGAAAINSEPEVSPTKSTKITNKAAPKTATAKKSAVKKPGAKTPTKGKAPAKPKAPARKSSR